MEYLVFQQLILFQTNPHLTVFKMFEARLVQGNLLKKVGISTF